MSVTTYAGVIEDVRVRLPAGVVLPEHTTVFVVVSDGGTQAIARLPGVRLADPADAVTFELKVAWGERP